jgi:AhpD family alkylhydroperoxidase
MRVTPIDSPKSRLLRVLSRLLRRQFGKDLTPYKVIFARLPRAIWAQLGIYWGLSGRLGLEPELQFLLQSHTAALNGCAFCLDIGRATATYRGVALEKLDAVHAWRSSPLFSARERAALAYVEEATQTRRVDDATFATLRSHFDDTQIVAITWLNAVENYFNLLNGPLEIGSDGLCAIAQQRAPGSRRTSSAAG